jgi:hypothetical protein
LAVGNVKRRNGRYTVPPEWEREAIHSKRKVGVYRSWHVWKWCIPRTACSQPATEKTKGRGMKNRGETQKRQIIEESARLEGLVWYH